MSQANASEWAVERWKQQLRSDYHSLLTEHLPTRLVEQDVSIAVGSFTDPDNPRGCVTMTGVALGDRINAEWTADEGEYIVAVLLYAARRVWEKYGDDRAVPSPARSHQSSS